MCEIRKRSHICERLRELLTTYKYNKYKEWRSNERATKRTHKNEALSARWGCTASGGYMAKQTEDVRNYSRLTCVRLEIQNTLCTSAL